MNVKVTSVLKDLTLSGKDFPSDEKNQRYFVRRLRALLEKGQQAQLVALDFGGIARIKPAYASATLGLIAARQPIPRLIILNSPATVATFLRSYTSLNETLAARNVLWPVIEQSGETSWLGVPDPKVRGTLNELLAGERTSLSDNLEFLVRQNPHIFAFDSETDIWGPSAGVRQILMTLGSLFSEWFQGRLQHLGIIETGHFELPSSLHIDRVVKSCLILNDPELRSRVATEVFRRFSTEKFTQVLTSSLLGVGLAEELARHHWGDIQCLTAYGYPDPRPKFYEGITPDSNVLVLADVVSSGKSLLSLLDFAHKKGAALVEALAIIDATGAARRMGVHALLTLQDEPYSPTGCSQCSRKKPLSRIDPFTSLPIADLKEPQETRNKINGEEFWSMVLENNALREGHLSFNGHHFSIFIDTRKLLANRVTRSKIARYIVEAYKESFDYILFPVHEAAVSLAQETALQYWLCSSTHKPQLLPASRTSEGQHLISKAQSNELRGRRVLILDDGANFGDTLCSLFLAAEEWSPKSIECCVFLDRLASVARRKVDAVLALQKTKLLSLFSLSFPAYHKIDCPICKRQQILRENLSSRNWGREYFDRETEQLRLHFLDDPSLSQTPFSDEKEEEETASAR